MAYSRYPSDDTFFVESDDSSQRMTVRDAAKMLARNKQEMIANELSRLACDEYLEDIMQHMRHMEVRNQKTCRGRCARDGGCCCTQRRLTRFLSFFFPLCRTRHYRMRT
jgi:hypothetical protein